MRLNCILITRLLPCVAILILLLSSTDVAGNQPNSILTLNQIEITQPDLFITSMNLDTDGLPEDGDLINLDITIRNDDNINYIGLELTLMIEENANLRHGPAPEIVVYNKSLSVIFAASTIVEQMSLVVEFGQYTITAGLMSNGTILPDSMNSLNVQVISQPIGQVGTLVLIIFVLLLLMIGLIAIPSVVDKIKSY
ncbi:MAG: hypothetical protein ACW99F_01490 [Candidatus Hodarchaeales archaeon]|jgi:hypothetical protein